MAFWPFVGILAILSSSWVDWIEKRSIINQFAKKNKAEYSALDASRRRVREGVTNLRTDGRSDRPSYRDARTHLKSKTNQRQKANEFRFDLCRRKGKFRLAFAVDPISSLRDAAPWLSPISTSIAVPFAFHVELLSFCCLVLTSKRHTSNAWWLAKSEYRIGVTVSSSSLSL